MPAPAFRAPSTLAPALRANLEAALGRVEAIAVAWEAAGAPADGACPCDTSAVVFAIRRAEGAALARITTAKPHDAPAAAEAAIGDLQRIEQAWPSE